MSINDNAHAEALRMNERIQRSIAKREYLADYMPKVQDCEVYPAPHMLRVYHYINLYNPTVLIMSREQALHLAVEIMQWLTDNPDEEAGAR